MKFLVDAQLPRRLTLHLREAGHDALHMLDLPAGNRTPDADIIAAATRDDRIVVTKDADFVESFVLLHAPPKLLLISTGNIRNSDLEALFVSALAVGDSGAVVTRLSRTLTPGGVLAIFYGNWLRPLYLPGYARLEHLICAARETMYARERAWQGQPHPERPLAWLRGAGLTGCRLQVLPVVYLQPLPEAVREYLGAAILGGHYADAVAACGREVGMTAEDEALWRRLSDPASPEYILDRSDYYSNPQNH